MKRTSLLIYLFSFLLMVINISPVFATVECTSKMQKAIQGGITTKAHDTLTSLKSTLDSYNNAAIQYHQKCGKLPESDTPIKLSDAAQQTAFTLLAKENHIAQAIVNPRNLRYTNVNWSAQSPTTQECKKLRDTASKLQGNLQTLQSTAEIQLGIYRKDEKIPVQCICDENIKNAECSAYASEEKESEDQIDGCKTFPEYLNELSSCPLCPVFSVILTTDAKMAKDGWKAFATELQKVVLAFFLAYLAFNTLKVIASPAGASTGSYLKTILGLGFKVAITYFMLANSEMIYKNFIIPVIKGGLDMGLTLLNIGNPGAKECVNQASEFGVAAGGELDASLLSSIYNTVKCFGESAAIMPAVGRGLICVGWENPHGILQTVGLSIPNFSMWLTGLILYIFGVAIWMVIGFYLIDCSVQLGIVCAITPIFIACWPFKITETYAKKGVQTLMNVFFNFALAGVMLVIGMIIVGYAATGNQSAAGGESGGLDAMKNALNLNDVSTLEKIASLDGLQILILVACCIFAFKLIAAINNVSDQFAQGSGSNIAPKIGGLAASTAKSVGAGALKIAGKGAATAAEVIADKTGVSDGAQRLKNATTSAIKGSVLGAASKAGAKIGLKKYQPKQQQGMPTQNSNKNQETTKNSEKSQNQEEKKRQNTNVEP